MKSLALFVLTLSLLLSPIMPAKVYFAWPALVWLWVGTTILFGLFLYLSIDES